MKSLILTLVATTLFVGGVLAYLQESAVRSAQRTVDAGGFQ